MDSQPRYTVAELFCGCGGFSHGFQKSGRFKVVLGVDVKKYALATFAHNHSEGDLQELVIQGDIRSISIDAIQEKLSRQDIGIGELDCLIGGPPCQGFSQMRRRELRFNDGPRFTGYDRLSDDPRNDLVLRFLEIASVLRPRFVLIENVPQMLQHGYQGRLGGLAKDIESFLKREMGYSVALDVLNAADYGVPQLRERAVFLASRDTVSSFPSATHSGTAVEQPLFSTHAVRKPWVTVRDAIGDLPEPATGEDVLASRSLAAYRKVARSDFAKIMRSTFGFPNGHVTRRYEPRIISIIKEMKPGETWDAASARMRLRYDRLIERSRRTGESVASATKRLQKEGVLNPAFFKRYYWSAYTRLDWDRPALTITANANFLGSGRFTHPDENRGITVREAARLQSFDDDFVFVTGENNSKFAIGVAMDMIGEAVPPLLAGALASHVAHSLDAASVQSGQATVNRFA